MLPSAALLSAEAGASRRVALQVCRRGTGGKVSQGRAAPQGKRSPQPKARFGPMLPREAVWGLDTGSEAETDQVPQGLQAILPVDFYSSIVGYARKSGADADLVGSKRALTVPSRSMTRSS